MIIGIVIHLHAKSIGIDASLGPPMGLIHELLIVIKLYLFNYMGYRIVNTQHGDNYICVHLLFFIIYSLQFYFPLLSFSSPESFVNAISKYVLNFLIMKNSVITIIRLFISIPVIDDMLHIYTNFALCSPVSMFDFSRISLITFIYCRVHKMMNMAVKDKANVIIDNFSYFLVVSMHFVRFSTFYEYSVIVCDRYLKLFMKFLD